jgi:hypothetical protein
MRRQQRFRQPPGADRVGQRAGETDIRRGSEPLDRPLDDRRVPDPESVHHELEERGSTVSDLHETEAQVGPNDRERDAGKAGPRAQVYDISRRIPEQRGGAEGIDKVPLAEPVPIAFRDHPHWDRPIDEETLVLVEGGGPPGWDLYTQELGQRTPSLMFHVKHPLSRGSA